jgi:hypothetical protein
MLSPGCLKRFISKEITSFPIVAEELRPRWPCTISDVGLIGGGQVPIPG